MQIKPLRSDLDEYLKKHGLSSRFSKQAIIFSTNLRHPSLHTECLEPKSLKIYSFRIDRKYRVIFIYTRLDEIEIVDINDHYQ